MDSGAPRLAPGRPNGTVDEMGLYLIALVGIAVAFIDVGYAMIAMPAALFLLLGLRFFRVSAALPEDRTGWLYAAVLIGTSVTPSLGAGGTVLRLGLAGLGLLAGLHYVLGSSRWMPTPALIGVATLVASLVFAAVLGASASFGITRFVNWVMFVPLLFAAFHRPAMRGAAFGVVVAAAVQMIGVLLQATGLFGGLWGGLRLTPGQWLTRYTGFILNPNDLALLLSLAVIVAAAALMTGLPGRLKYLLGALIVVFLWGVILTGSRGGIVAVGLGIAVLLAARGLRALAVGTVLAAVAGAYLYTSTAIGVVRVLESLGEIVRGQDPSTIQRAQVWEDRMAGYDLTDIALGRGFGGYAPHLFGRVTELDIPAEILVLGTVDNGWLKLGLESGIVGVVALAAVMLTALSCGLVRARSLNNGLAGAATAACLVALLWRSTSVDLLDANPWNAWICLAVGLGLATGAPDRTGQSVTPHTDSSIRRARTVQEPSPVP
jgi:O-antigen ligase